MRHSIEFRSLTRRQSARPLALVRRAASQGLIVGAVLVAGWASLPASAAAAVPRIDLKVLLIGTSTTEPDFQAWQSALQREGVPFTSLIESSATASGTGHTSIGVTGCTGTDPCQVLSDTASDGSPEAKYDGVIVAVGGLPICPASGACTSALSSADLTALEQFEHEFNVRQITGDVYPSATYGLNTPSVTGSLDGTTGTLTADGLKAFPYLNGSVLFGNYPANTTASTTFGYQATPITGANFDTFLTGPNNSALAGVYTDSKGVQQLVETYNQNQYLLQDQLLQHGALNWLTRGVYFGDQRNYLETDVDDNFLSDDSWSIAGTATAAAHSTDFNPADALREVPADITAAAQWSKANNFRIDMLFNGGGSVAVADGDSLVGAGDSGSGTTGSTGTTGGSGCTSTNPCSDPLLAQFQLADPATGKPYTDDFGWISHTWDHPNIDEGCATQDYIEAELNQNTTWGATAASSGNPIAGGLGLTDSTDPTDALGNENPNVVITGEHSGIANLLPGNPGQVDPPSLDDAVAADTTSPTAGALAAGEYVYAVSDQFNTAAPGATPVPGTGESEGSVSSPVTVTSPNNSVTLTWGAVCHAADYKIYRALYTPPPAGSTTGTIGTWALIGTVQANTTTDFTNPTVNPTTNTAGGGAIEKTFTDTGTETTSGGAPPTVGSADESPYEQNPVLDAAFAGTLDGGIKYFGSDASKPYPNPADGSFATGSYTGAEYPAAATFSDAGATAIPRYPTNIYYNVSTNAQEVDEYQTLYDLAPSGDCQPIANVTTCNPSGTAFTIAQILASVDQGMFAHMMGNDPRPTYFHQTNLMSQTTGTVNGEGDGLFYETLNPLLAEYHQYFAANAPIEQLTMAQIGALLTEQAGWAGTGQSQVSGYIQGNQVTITNTGAGAVNAPLTGITTVGSTYGGTQSGWTSVPAGTSTYTAQITWPVDTVAVSLSPSTIGANGKSTSNATVTVSSQGNPVAGDTLSLGSSDAGNSFGAVTDKGNGTYTATITSSKTADAATITATDTSVAGNPAGQATLTQTPEAIALSLNPGSIAAGGSSTSTATATVSDAEGDPTNGQQVTFTSSDPGERIGAVTDHGNGTYTATITSSKTAGHATITATDSSVTPNPRGTATLTQSGTGGGGNGGGGHGGGGHGGGGGQHPTKPANRTSPTISGTAIVGRTVTASSGSWSGSSPITYHYRWQRCNPKCTAISATGRTYKLRSADRGAHLRVVVTASNSVGTAQADSAQIGPAITPGTAAQIMAQLGRTLTPTGNAARITAMLKHGGYRVALTTPVSGRLHISWYLAGNGAQATTKTLLAGVAVTQVGNHHATIMISLTGQGRQSLSHANKHLRLSGQSTFAIGGTGTPLTSGRTFTINR